MPGTITPAPDFNVEKDCQELRTAMKGLGTNEAKIINVLGNRSRDQRLEIVVKFKVSIALRYSFVLIENINTESHFKQSSKLIYLQASEIYGHNITNMICRQCLGRT